MIARALTVGLAASAIPGAMTPVSTATAAQVTLSFRQRDTIGNPIQKIFTFIRTSQILFQSGSYAGEFPAVTSSVRYVLRSDVGECVTSPLRRGSTQLARGK